MNSSADCRPWFEKHPHWFKEQSDILKSAGFELNNEVLARERRVQFQGHAKVDPDRLLIVEFPAAFPSAAPKIRDTPSSKLLPRHHRGDTRQLCLFGFDENRWNAEKSVGDALAEAEELISQFKDGKAVPEAQPPEPITRVIQYVSEGAILIPPPISTFNNFAELKSPRGKFLLKFAHAGNQNRGTAGRGVVIQATFGGQKFTGDHPFVDYLGNTAQVHGDWFFLPDSPSQEEFPKIVNEHVTRWKASRKTDFYWMALIFREESGRSGQSRLAWVIARANAKGEFHLIRTLSYIQNERDARIPGLEGLPEKRITVIGCGSLGSKIAANLAASGIKRFHLVDFDYFEPNNSVRHELGTEFFGMNKAVALLPRLCSLNPAAVGNSDAFPFQVASVGAFSAEQRFYDLVRESDLIVDTAGMHSVSHFLNDLSFETGVPVLYATVTNGAWGGEIVRTIPGKTPCWSCWLDQYFDSKPPSAPKSSAEIFAPGCDQPTFTGTTYDLGIVASLASLMVVETLLRKPEDLGFSKNYVRWAGRDNTGNMVFRTELLDTSFQKNCWLCGS